MISSFDSKKNGIISSNVISTSNNLSFNEKVKILEEYFEDGLEELSPIPEEEEIESQEGNLDIYQCQDANKKEIAKESTNKQLVSNLSNHQPELSDNSPTIHCSNPHLFQTSQSTLYLLSSNSAQKNRSLPLSMLNRSISLSSLIDRDISSHQLSNNSPPPLSPLSSSYHPIGSQSSFQSSLASSTLDLTVHSNRSSSQLSIGQLSTSSLAHSKSYFLSQINLNSGSINLLQKIHNRNQQNSIINRLKSRIKSASSPSTSPSHSSSVKSSSVSLKPFSKHQYEKSTVPKSPKLFCNQNINSFL